MAQFNDCWLRIGRARKHRDNLVDAWNRFLEDEPYSSGVEVQDDGTGRIHVMPRGDSLPDVFALEFGEMLYQLRAALDASVYQSAVLDCGKDPPAHAHSLEFPILTRQGTFDEDYVQRKIRPLSSKRKSFIESVQPYNAGRINRTVGILSDWARKDRHRTLHILLSWAANINPLLRIPDGTSLISIDTRRDGFLEKESVIATFRLTGWIPGMNIEANPNLTIDIAIDETPPPDGPTDTLSNRIEFMFLAVEEITSRLAGMN
ncbi:MAG TPA: hypothetical protein VK419_12740 [Bryobacteraceae bacterium]|nr:hypothetical protein [Bryobacteraceae bacterium]